LLCCFYVSWWGALAAVAETPSLRFADAVVILDQGTPGGEVAWISVTRVPLGYHQRLEVRRTVSAADETGTATWEQERPPWLGSIWAAVDVESGAWVAAAPPGGRLRDRVLPAHAFQQNGSGELSSVHYPGHVVAEATVVRTGPSQAGTQIWGLRLTDGGQADGDAQYNGEITLQLSSMEGLTDATTAASTFAAGDVVILIDTDRMEVSATRLEEGHGGAGGER
jgi:hypothetical protein